jgi:hypothetical protein
MIEMTEVLTFRKRRLTLAIREAAIWYKSHLTASLRASRIPVPEIVLLTNDQKNLERAKAVGVRGCSSIFIVIL